MKSVVELFDHARSDTQVAVTEYWLNSAFLRGHQWVFQDPQSGDVRDQYEDDDRLRVVFNAMAANHRTLISNLTQRHLSFEVMPNHADAASARGAHVGQQILRALHDEHDWELVRERLVVSLLKGGVAGIALDWDEDRKDSVETVLPVSNFVIEPGNGNPEFARWWIKVQLFTPEKVQSMFGMDEKPAADATAGLSKLGRGLLSYEYNQGEFTDMTAVYTYYQRPSKDDEGRVVTEVNGHIVQNLPWNFPFRDRLNIVIGNETVDENNWWGSTVYTQARKPQVAINMAWSNILEHHEDAAQSRMLVPHGAVELMKHMDDRPGNMYPYPDGLEKPMWLQPPQLPAWVQNVAPEARQMLDDIMGVHDVSRGMAPSNLESGTALSILAEKDSSPVGRLIKITAGMFTRLGKMELQLHEQESKNSRITTIQTEGGSLAIEWTGSDIQGQHDAFVPLEAIVPISRAAMQQQGIKLLEMGAFGDGPSAMIQFLRFTEAPNFRDIVNVTTPDAAKAMREHSQFARGEVVLPATFDDHEIHMDQHNRFRKTVAYEQLSDAERKLVDDHITAHETTYAEQLATQRTRQEADPALGGTPGAQGLPTPEALPPVDAGAPPTAPPPALPPEAQDPTGNLDQVMAMLEADLS